MEDWIPCHNYTIMALLYQSDATLHCLSPLTQISAFLQTVKEKCQWVKRGDGAYIIQLNANISITNLSVIRLDTC